jgi:uncharacterized protein
MSIADFLIPAGMQQVLGRLYGSPDRTYRLTELLDTSTAGRGNAQRQVQRLLDAGVLLEDARSGRQRSIRVNTEFALYPELRAIVAKSFGLVEPFREALQPFQVQIDEAFIFGSVAKGTDTFRSDVDLMVVGTASLLELTDVMLVLEKNIGRPIHMTLYGREEWSRLVENDAVVAAIVQGPKLQILPDDSSR